MLLVYNGAKGRFQLLCETQKLRCLLWVLDVMFDIETPPSCIPVNRNNLNIELDLSQLLASPHQNKKNLLVVIAGTPIAGHGYHVPFLTCGS